MAANEKTVQIDIIELSVLILEAVTMTSRPEGLSPSECLLATGDMDRDGAIRAAEVAAAYVLGCLGDIVQVTGRH